jgi:hypothetical protein
MTIPTYRGKPIRTPRTTCNGAARSYKVCPRFLTFSIYWSLQFRIRNLIESPVQFTATTLHKLHDPATTPSSNATSFAAVLTCMAPHRTATPSWRATSTATATSSWRAATRRLFQARKHIATSPQRRNPGSCNGAQLPAAPSRRATTRRPSKVRKARRTRHHQGPLDASGARCAHPPAD